MLDYKLWQFHQTINEVNDIIENANRFLSAQKRRQWFWEDETTVRPEEGPKKLSRAEAEVHLPKLGYLVKRRDGQPGAQWFIDDEKRKNSNPSFNAEKAGIRSCLVKAYKEEEAVQRDGIRFPPGVIVNKINHRVFNYDQIQDKISELVSNGELDCCDALDIRIRLKDKIFKLGQQVIEMIKFPLKVGGGVDVGGGEVIRTHERFYRRDMDELRMQKSHNGCGDCGGGRSSARWSKPAPRHTRALRVN